MRHIDENMLEQLLKRPDSLSANDRESLDRHLASCSVCRDTIDFLRSIHAELDGTIYPGHPRVRELLDSLFPRAHIIPLTPYRYVPDPPPVEGNSITVLAAMSSDTAEMRFETVATLVSEKDGALVRILHDRSVNQFRVFVNVEDDSKRDHAIVSIPSIPLELVTDSNGQATFEIPRERIPLDWRGLNAMLRTPVATLRIDTTGLLLYDLPVAMEVPGLSGIVKLSLRDGDILLEVPRSSGDTPEIAQAVITTPAGKSYLLVLQDARTLLARENLDESITLRLYQ
jgi:hypothetical protein